MADPNSPDGPNGNYVLPKARVDHIPTRKLDLAYAGSSALQKLNLDRPAGPAPEGGWPLIVFVHGGAPTARPGMVIAANPETWVTKDCPPSYFLHAPADPIVPVQHSCALARRIARHAGPGRVKLRLVENAGHATPEFNTPEVLANVADFLTKALGLPAGRKGRG